MHDTGCLGLVHWDDPEGWYGEGGGRKVQDGAPWRRRWQPTPVFVLENPMNRETWWAAIYGVAESYTTDRTPTGEGRAGVGPHLVCLQSLIKREVLN